MRFGIIIAAGNQTRFKSTTPKALVKIKGQSLLKRNFNHLSEWCDEVYVVCSKEKEDDFKREITPPNVISINSGYGCGDAVLQALNSIKINAKDTVFIQWGDSLHASFIYKKIIDNYKNVSILPCVKELNPYVEIREEPNYKITVLFSKYGEVTSPGFHDLSLFYANAEELRSSLQQLQNKLKTKNGYVSKHGNEMTFLDVYNETPLKGTILEILNYSSFSFNTQEELLIKEQTLCQKRLK